MGVSARLAVGASLAVDLGAGASSIGDGGPCAHVDLLWHAFALASGEAAALRLYLGLGARVMSAEGRHQGDELHVGVRAPVGLVWQIQPAQLELFAEVAGVADFVQHNGQVLDGELGIGVRYAF